MTPRFPRLYAAAILIVCMAVPFAVTIEAKGRKAKKSVSRSKGRAPLRASAKHRSGVRTAANLPESNYAVVPDQIEVLENGSSRTTELARWLNPPAPRSSFLSDASLSPTTSVRTRAVRIESSRVLQIQQALAGLGFFSGEMSGVYDGPTADAMRRCQAANRIAVTGYPTAAALKRLGLTNW
ncbi:MAG: peptidoglycan-binding domain-containing protein [Blastocatellia bacterium]